MLSSLFLLDAVGHVRESLRDQLIMLLSGNRLSSLSKTSDHISTLQEADFGLDTTEKQETHEISESSSESTRTKSHNHQHKGQDKISSREAP